MNRVMKTEHNGAKNGGGFWGRREEAKSLSRRKRRQQDKKEVFSAKAEYETKKNTSSQS